MSFQEFQASLQRATPPAGLGGPLLALWHDARGNWAAAHEQVQEDVSSEGAWVHAYLHRKEGDAGNAGYWYARAGRPAPGADVPFEAEWTALAQMLSLTGP